MGDKLDSMLKKVFLSALAGIGASNASIANEKTMSVDLINYDNKVQSFSEKSNDLSPKLILKKTSENELNFLAHRSHRSHSSHRSHYSSSSGGSYTPPPTSPSKSTSPSSTPKSNLYSQPATNSSNSSGIKLGPGPATTLHLGDRTLKLGMEGNDVTELVNILLKMKYLQKDDGGTQVTGILEYNSTIEAAVKKFQADNALTINGICDSTTIYYLKNK